MTTPTPPVRAYLANSRVQWLIAAALLLGFILLAWLQRVPSLATGNDDATYVLLSRSLREGGYNSIHLVGTPVHTKYPPVFPALLAMVSSVFGESIDAFAAMNIALVAASLALLFAVARRRLPPAVALGALVISATSPFLQGTAGTVMSEPAFLAIIGLTLWILAREPLTTRSIALACVGAAAAALTRTIGATLVLAVIALLLLERRWRSAAVFGGVLALLVIAASLWLRAHAMPELAADYLTDATDPGNQAAPNAVVILGRRLALNGQTYAGSLLWLLSLPTVRGTVIDNVLWLVIVAAALAAGLWLFWRQWRIVPLFALIYGALILAWAWAIGRFLIPLFPLIAIALLAGLHLLFTRWGSRAASAAVIALTTIIGITGIARSAERIAVRQQCDRESAMESPSCFNVDQLSFFAAARYVGQHTPASAIIVSANEATTFYLANRRLVPADSMNAVPPARAADFLRQHNVSYAVLHHVAFAAIPLSTRLAGACDHLEPVAEFPPRTVVFRVLSAASSDTRACELLRAYAEDAGRFLPQIF
ncbi:MAG TPA: glycosyltransferase family 39 protein [Gemmatimonadaceae bacterium]